LKSERLDGAFSGELRSVALLCCFFVVDVFLPASIAPRFDYFGSLLDFYSCIFFVPVLLQTS